MDAIRISLQCRCSEYDCASACADEVEKPVTVPLEMALGRVAGVTEMRLLSRFGLSQMDFNSWREATFTVRVSRDRAIAEGGRFSRPGLTPKLIPITTGRGEVFYYTIDYAPMRQRLRPRASAI